MVVEFTTNLVDSSYLGCPMFKKKVLWNETRQKKRIFSLFLQKKYNNILVKKLFFSSSKIGWNCLERNKGVKYIGERKIKLLDLTFLPNFHQLNLEQSITPKKNILK